MNQVHIQVIRSVAAMQELLSVFQEVFEMGNIQTPPESHLRKLLTDDHFFAVAAIRDDQVIAGLTGYRLDRYYSEKPVAYLYDLAVLSAYQRKGIGSRLLAFTMDYCREQGYDSVFVQAEKQDEEAIGFYRSTRPEREDQAVQFTYVLNTGNGGKTT